ncbi:hypothetical protein [Paraburkholderia aspalathi]|uniref:hypothetical protein n=1 Tax=Paraburkholderia aspalathi TaxID=1324617 RepID=UPI003C87D3DF
MSRDSDAASIELPARHTVVYRDTVFRSRTVVFADGSTLAVEKSLVTATTQEHVAALDRDPDFERMTDGS